MVLEIAQIEIQEGMHAEFEANVQKAEALFAAAKGCRGMQLQRSLEFPLRYRLFVKWETVDNHMIDFRGSADFQAWRRLVAHCFASTPSVEHTTLVGDAFEQ